MSAPSQRPPSERLSGLTIDPEPASGAWTRSLRAARTDERAKGFRRQLGLPLDRAIVMTGHQAQFWHPGILAKYMAAEIAARSAGAVSVWIVVDQDSHDPGEVRLPVRRAGRLASVTWHALGACAELSEGDVPTARMQVEEPVPPALDDGVVPAEPFVEEAARRIEAALARGKSAPSAAHQVSGAAGALLEESGLVQRPAAMVHATSLGRTELMGWLVERMRADPGACTRAYNAAVAASSHAHVAELQPGELPLWHIPARVGSPRRPVTADGLAGIPGAELAPKALLMTAMFRLAGCDLFVHGTGGAAYDRITERWIGEWLGVRLCPTATVTATLLLPLEGSAITPEEIARARWHAHAARHDPGLVGDRGAADEKRRLLQEIRAAKRARQSPAPAFARMQAVLERSRVAHAPELARLDQAAAAARARREEAAVLADRTWPFPLYPADDLMALKRAVAARFGEAT